MRSNYGGAVRLLTSVLLGAAIVACAQAQPGDIAEVPAKKIRPADPPVAGLPRPQESSPDGVETEFRQRLERLYASQPDAPPAEVNEALRIKQQLGDSVLQGTFLQPPPASSLTPLASSPFPSPPATDAALLRDTSEQLDLLANRLERARLYDRADALRAQATELRHAARALQPAGNSAARKPKPKIMPLP